MITKGNLIDMLKLLSFNVSSNTYTKHFDYLDCSLTVDIKNEQFIYPKEITINERQTCNFSSNENFVVFECIHRLLTKGYRPQDIELEPRWQLGRGAKGGRADIWIRTTDNEGLKHSLLIIECKTSGAEYKNAWNDTLDNGGQLFSYFQQERETKFLCLYNSNIVDNNIKPEYCLIRVQDNDEYLANSQQDRSYSKASSFKEVFGVWKDTYHQEYATRGLFEEDIAAYKIGKNKYSILDLEEVDAVTIQKKYNEFASILRQHNVSGHENAFDKLVNLFLAKVVDETSNPNELSFYWKGFAYDDYFSLQDRIQKLYKEGMMKFLGEDITYIDNNDIHNAFRLFKNDPDATRDAVLNYFRQLKFFTNNDFAFIDVHNEKLFYQNSEVLLKIVLMLQDIKLKTEDQNQFLGDLFENFLDKGVKQSEGQFFTPLPIVRFLVSSLPLEKMITENNEPIQCIDYACGAGHFLNEYAEQIKPFVKNLNREYSLKDYYKAITGIEKEYRLSKVAKVSAFMYGQDDIKIVYTDALASNKKIKDGKYSVLIANPPYSVKGFLETLSLQDRKRFILNNAVSDVAKNNSIETFFIERAAQLLKSGGVAAIILPSSILSNGGVYAVCREIILEKFDIIAMAEFGSGTFGKTGTNTVTLFLRKQASIPSISKHYKNRVTAWFNGNNTQNQVFADSHLLSLYCKHIGIELVDYMQFINNRIYPNIEVFTDYQALFKFDARAKAISKKKITIRYTQADKDTELDNYIYSSICNVEKKKVYFYLLAQNNSNKVLIMKSPVGNKESKEFLGYEWSGAKGDEGIKFTSENNTIKQIVTPLFDPSNLSNKQKINTLIRDNYIRATVGEIPKELKNAVSYIKVEDMIDFTRTVFDLGLRTNTVKRSEVSSKYPMVKLYDVCDILIGGTPSRKKMSYFTGSNLWVSISEMKGGVITETKEKITDEAVKESNVKLIPKGTTLLSFKLSIGKTAIAGADLYTNEAIAGLIPRDKNNCLDAYIYSIFNARIIDLQNIGNKAFGKSLNTTYLKTEVKIPIPPLEIQKEIIAECKKIDDEYNSSRMSIEQYRLKIAKVFENLDVLYKQMGGGVIS